ncbi:DUF4296 domain-containing protein [Pedobacter metabolipauper]|uniref:Uncharacterized protein DUF4296 n=1 Tax=Pedobacter metabolipauper TaxID=425513 RepID=A0A4R6T082_9SPHI|nr:DUF4296 domain-containing protein [Pedobacter metabolipauper]TDQ10968.1 uncharacterized protein DUF4296 [Pedobacter metabolipauper]
MRKILYLYFIFLFAAGCKPGVPKDIIQPDQMALVLNDIHVVDGYVSSITAIDSAKRVATAYYKGIYKKFNIDSALYNKSMDYYYTNPRLLDEIYSKVTKGLNKQKATIIKSDSLYSAKMAKMAKQKIKADSLKKATDSLKKVKAVKKADTIKNVKSAKLTKQQKTLLLKKRTDSIKRADSLKQIKRSKRTRLNSVATK